MVVIKNINNNVSLCRDGNGKRVIVIGRGVGFLKPPAEVPLSRIEQTFYNVNSHYMNILQEVPSEILDFTAQQIALFRSRLPYEVTSNLTFVLADHISFALERAKKGVYIPMPSAYELESSWPLEMELGRAIVSNVEKEFNVKLPRGEVQAVAMHFINARTSGAGAGTSNIEDFHEEILESITQIIEKELSLTVRRDSFNYARFATHVQYLLRRIFDNRHIDSDNLQIYKSIQEEYASTSACVNKIAAYLRDEWHAELSEEEQLYLIMHINRVCAKEKN